MQTAKARRLWIFTRRLTALLLLAWLAATLLGPWLARELQGQRLFGFALGYWLVAQGALFVYLAVVVGFDLTMSRAEARYRDASQAPEPPEPGARSAGPP